MAGLGSGAPVAGRVAARLVRIPRAVSSDGAGRDCCFAPDGRAWRSAAGSAAGRAGGRRLSDRRLPRCTPATSTFAASSPAWTTCCWLNRAYICASQANGLYVLVGLYYLICTTCTCSCLTAGIDPQCSCLTEIIQLECSCLTVENPQESQDFVENHRSRRVGHFNGRCPRPSTLCSTTPFCMTSARVMRFASSTSHLRVAVFFCSISTAS